MVSEVLNETKLLATVRAQVLFFRVVDEVVAEKAVFTSVSSPTLLEGAENLNAVIKIFEGVHDVVLYPFVIVGRVFICESGHGCLVIGHPFES